MNEAIKLAIEKGGYTDYQGDFSDATRSWFLDPAFWQALERAMDWKWKAGKTIPWILHWHRFIDWVAEGKDVDEFFKQLIQNK